MKPVRSLRARILARLGCCSRAGTRSWLVERELRYGGYATGIPRRSVSEFDSRDLQGLDPCGMTGGDRMSPRHHNYGRLYARYLPPFLDKGTSVTLIEVGILEGTGLAIWSNLFPKGRIIGLDIDLSISIRISVDSSTWEPSKRGTTRFTRSTDLWTIPDSWRTSCVETLSILRLTTHPTRTISILTTFESVRPFLAENFLYVIEDNKRVHCELARKYPQFRIDSFGALTMVTSIK